MLTYYYISIPVPLLQFPRKNVLHQSNSAFFQQHDPYPLPIRVKRLVIKADLLTLLNKQL